MIKGRVILFFNPAFLTKRKGLFLFVGQPFPSQFLQSFLFAVSATFLMPSFAVFCIALKLLASPLASCPALCLEAFPNQPPCRRPVSFSRRRGVCERKK
jgi:hypothetical protein